MYFKLKGLQSCERLQTGGGWEAGERCPSFILFAFKIDSIIYFVMLIHRTMVIDVLSIIKLHVQ